MFLLIGLINEVVDVLDRAVGIAELRNHTEETLRVIACEITFA